MSTLLVSYALSFFRVGRVGRAQLAYPPVVASGYNACTVHYMENASEFREGDTVLVDSGADVS